VNDAVEALQAKVGVNGSAVTTSLDYKVANQGLTLVKTQTIANYAASVTLTGVFSSTFDNYRILVSGGVTVNGAGLLFSLGGAGNVHSSTVVYYTIGSGTINTAVKSNQSLADIGGINSAIDLIGAGDVLNYTFASCVSADAVYYRSSAAKVEWVGIPTSITLSVNYGTFYQATVRVYGYNNG
jgi:hypothetical protein